MSSSSNHVFASYFVFSAQLRCAFQPQAIVRVFAFLGYQNAFAPLAGIGKVGFPVDRVGLCWMQLAILEVTRNRRADHLAESYSGDSHESEVMI